MTPQIAREGHQNERKVDIFVYKSNAPLDTLKRFGEIRPGK